METLYSQIGSIKLNKLVDLFYGKVLNSPTISYLFQNDVDLIKEKQFLFLSQFLGGPQNYSERFGHPKMRARHLPHRIDNKAKDEWLRCMKEAIQEIDLSVEIKVTLYDCFPKVAQHMVNS